MSFTRLPRTDPTSILRYRDGIYAADLLTAAIVEFDFFTWVANHPGSLEDLCEGLGWAARPADVLVTLGKANGFLSEGPEGTIRVTMLAREHLVTGSPWSLRGYFESLKDRPVVRDFAAVLRSGKPASWSGHDQAEFDWHGAMRNEDFAIAFTEAMDCRGVFLGKALADALAEELVGRRGLLDVGGGSGVYACALAANQPHLSAVVLEQPPVDELARRKIAERGLGDRVEVLAGDMFAGGWPASAEVHLFSNVMHDWDLPEIRQLLAHSAAALPPGGLVAVHETFLNPDKTGPLPVAEYSCILMHSTQGRCYSVAEMAALLEEAGFVRPRHLDTAGDRGVVLAVKP